MREVSYMICRENKILTKKIPATAGVENVRASVADYKENEGAYGYTAVYPAGRRQIKNENIQKTPVSPCLCKCGADPHC